MRNDKMLNICQESCKFFLEEEFYTLLALLGLLCEEN